MNLRNKSRELQSFFHKRQNLDGYIIFAICVAFTIFHFICANFPKTMETYPDELIYYEISRGIHNGIGISFRNIPFGFQKIAYSLIILPTFLFTDSSARNMAISLLNSILMTSSVIPIWSIAKTLKLNTFFRYTLIVQTLLWPDMFFSMTFISENLYWPLLLFFIDVWLKSINSQKHYYSIISGVICFLCYLCKEIALAILLAYILFEFLHITHNVFENKTVKNAFNKKRITKLLLFLLSFSVLLILVKLVFFSNVKNLYYEIGISPKLTKYTLLYILYGFIIYCMAITTVIFLFPIAYPVLHFKNMGHIARELFLFIGLILIITAMAVSYLVMAREDLGHETPRIHLRYISPLLPLFLAIFYSLLQDDKSNIHSSLLSYLVLILPFFFIFKGTISGSAIDHCSLLWYEKAQSKIGNLTANGGMTINLYAFVLNSILCLIWLSLHICFCKSRRIGTLYFLICILISCTLDNILTEKRLRNAYKIPSGLTQHLESVKLLQEENKNILFLGNCFSKESKLFDVYFENTERIIFSNESDFYQMTSETSIRDISFYESVYHIPYKHFSEISYIVILPDSKIIPLNSTPIPELSNAIFTTYKNNNPKTLGFTERKEFCYSFNGQNISNGYDKGRVRYLRPDGCSFGPYISLEKGLYTVTITGKNLSSSFIDVYSQYGNLHHYFSTEEKDGNLKINFKLEEPSENLEVLVQNKGSQIMEIDSFVLKKNETQEEYVFTTKEVKEQ